MNDESGEVPLSFKMQLEKIANLKSSTSAAVQEARVFQKEIQEALRRQQDALGSVKNAGGVTESEKEMMRFIATKMCASGDKDALLDLVLGVSAHTAESTGGSAEKK